MSEPLLRARDLRKVFTARRGLWSRSKYDETVAVDGVSFELPEGQTLGVVGESGSGKTTTGRLVLQLIRPTSGSVRFRGAELTELRGERLRHMRREMQMVFQDPYASLDPRLRVGQIVAEPLDAHNVGTRASRLRRVAELLELVGFDPGMARRRPGEFSGGQRQRIAIARSLSLNPKLLVCDEPVSALDVSIQAQILNLLRDVQQRLGIAYLFISHDLGVVRVMSDKIAVMKDGRIIETGAADAIYQAPQHPYTKRLLAAVPVADPAEMEKRKLERRQLPAFAGEA